MHGGKFSDEHARMGMCRKACTEWSIQKGTFRRACSEGHVQKGMFRMVCSEWHARGECSEKQFVVLFDDMEP